MGLLLCKENTMKPVVKILLSVVAVVAAAICVLCCLYIYQYFRGGQLTETVAGESAPNATIVVGNASTEPSMTIGIDFASLQEMNEEIYAWVELPGADISHAVVQSATNDLFYNDHNIDKSYYSGGSIFSQRYNTTTFEDPVTVLYGHNRHSHTMFAPLNDFAAADVFEANRYIFIYTPETVYQYEIFAAYPHSSEHLLLCHDFTDSKEFADYFAQLKDGLDTHYRRELFPEEGNKVLTLSTCYKRNRMQRYLVQGVLTQTYNVVEN